MNQSDFHLARIDRGQQRLKRGVAVGAVDVRSKADGLADVAGYIVEQVDRSAELDCSAMLGPNPAGDRQTRTVRGKFPGQALNSGSGNSGFLGGNFRSKGGER